MAIDKSNTPTWMKVVLIILAAVFVLGFVSVAANPFTLFAPQPGTGQAGTTGATSPEVQRAQQSVNALTGMLQSNPESYTVLVSLGNSYYDWALAVQKTSQNSTTTAGADLPMWIAAKDAYSRAAKINSTEPPVMVDYSITQYYSGDASSAVATAQGVTKTNASFAPAWFNLGIYYRSLGDNKNAIASFEQYVKLDPKGTQGDINYAKQQLTELKAQ